MQPVEVVGEPVEVVGVVRQWNSEDDSCARSAPFVLHKFTGARQRVQAGKIADETPAALRILHHLNEARDREGYYPYIFLGN